MPSGGGMEEDSRQRNSVKNIPEKCMTCLGKDE